MKVGLVFFLLATLTLAQPDGPGKSTAPARRALLIANSAYRYLPPLDTPKSNVNALANALSKVHFQIQVAADLPQGAMIRTIQDFMASVQTGDFILIFFSGYGYQVDDLPFLLPITFNPEETSAPAQRALSVRYLISQLDQSHAGVRMLLFDANRSLPDIPGGLGTIDPPSNTLIAFSAAANQSAFDPPGGGINSFTAALTNALEEPGATPGRVLARAQAEVEHASGGKQVPYVVQTPVEDFFFTEPRRSSPLPSVSILEIKSGQNRENKKDRLTYVWIPSGNFKMGCVPDDTCEIDEKPQHDVKITEGFWITRTEVTTGAYQRFTNQTGYREPRKTQTNPKRMGTDLPVTKVTWDDAKAYCEWAGGRLPTEAEWEYAARGGRPDLKYPWGNEFDPKLANSFKTDLKLKEPFTETVDVRRIGNGNGFDLFDVVGNAREWTSDYYDPGAYKSPPPVVDPTGPIRGKDRVVRGGSFSGTAKHLRISARDHLDSGKEDNETGFRCVLPSLTPDK